MNNFFTDEAWNLYDWNRNLVAYAWQYQIDENGNIFLNSNSQYQTLTQNQEYSENNLASSNSANSWLNQQDNVKKEKKHDFSKILQNLFPDIFWWNDTVEVQNQNWLKSKKLKIAFDEKFPSEYNFSEDLINFSKKITDTILFFQKEKKFTKNAARWKLLLVSKKEVIWFLDQLSTLINSWIRLVDGVVILQKQAKNQSVQILLKSLAEKMWNWMHLSEAFQDYDYIFPEKWIQMIKAAEKSWKMSEVLVDLAREEIAQMEFISKIRWAMIYPWILITMAILVFWLMMTKMVPSLEKSFWSIDKFPALTKNIIRMSHYMQDHFWVILFYPLAFFVIYIFLKSQFITMKKIVNFISLRLPIFWNISRMKNIVMFADNLSLMLSAWVVASEWLKITAETLPSILYQKEVHKIRRWVNNWKTISQMMWLSWKMDDDNVKENFYFWLEIAQMIKIWEETWNTLWVLKKISETNTNKLNNIVKNLTSLLEPMITLIIWWMVWTLIIAFMIPMMSSFQNVG